VGIVEGLKEALIGGEITEIKRSSIDLKIKSAHRYRD